MYSLRTKILTISLVLVVCLGTVFVFYSRISTRNYKRLRIEYIEMMAAQEKEIMNRVISDMELGVITLSREEMIEVLSAIRPTRNSFVLLFDPHRDIIIVNTHSSTSIDEALSLIPWDINADSFAFNSVDYISFSQVLNNGWSLSIYIPEREIFAEIERWNLHFLLSIVLASILMLFIAFRLISNLTYKPIMQLASEVTNITLDNLDQRITVHSKDELGLLAQTFDKITSDLKESIEAHARERIEKERMTLELTMAAELQSSLLPNVFPPFPGITEFDLYASMLPAKKIGGDFYDFFMINEKTIAIVIADVAGKGITAALFMVVTKTLIKNNARSGKSPGEVFEIVNNILCESNNTGIFVTAFMGYYNTVSGRFVFANAGHTPPFLKKSGEDHHFLELNPNLVLACMENTFYHEEEITLEQDDLLFFYTDGVTEAMNAKRDFFSDERLFEVLKECKDKMPEELLHIMRQEINDFVGNAEQADDITMLAIKINHMPEPLLQDLIIDADMANLGEVISFINDELELNDCPMSLRSYIDLAVEEIFINIAKYAYTPDKGVVTISINVGEEAIIKFEDSGQPYNPLEQAPPDISKPLEDREIGGFGVLLVSQLMDKLDYSRIDDKNILTMSKRIKYSR